MDEARHYGSVTVTVTLSLKRDLCSASFKTWLVEDPLRAGYNAGLRRRLCNNSRQGELHPLEVAPYTTCQHISLLGRHWHQSSFEIRTKKIILEAFKWSVSEKSLKSAPISNCWLLHPAGYYTPTSHRYLPHTVPGTFNTPSHGSSTQKKHQSTNFCSSSHMYDVPLSFNSIWTSNSEESYFSFHYQVKVSMKKSRLARNVHHQECRSAKRLFAPKGDIITRQWSSTERSGE